MTSTICTHHDGSIVGLFHGQTAEEIARNNPGFVCYATNLQSLPAGKLYDPKTDTLSDDPAYVPPPAPVPTEVEFDAALTAHLDSTARARRYDNRITCALRAGYPGPFQAEGQAFALWMDTCNAQAYQTLAAVQAGTAPVPTVAEFIASLPAMTWPN